MAPAPDPIRGIAGRPVRRIAALALLLPLLQACATVPYEFGTGPAVARTPQLAEGEAQFERGEPQALLDGLGHYLLSLPTKLLLLSWKVDNHDISEETEAAVGEYLAANDLGNVKVRLNQYAPGDEWRRLKANREIGPVWRYTAGALTVAAYTLLPQRLFGGDNYNPFTHTISLYSDDRAIALHEGGHAKDFVKTRHKGLYATLRLLPLVPLVQEGRATGDALGYERERGSSDDEKHAYRILYPAYGTYVGGEASRWITGPSWLFYAVGYGAAVPGHIIGWIRSAFVDDRDTPAAEELDLSPRPEAGADSEPSTGSPVEPWSQP